jgi:hypothetical protein
MLGLASDLRAATPPQIEQARMHAELRKIEPRLATADSEIVEKIQRVITDARTHLDAALTLWRQHIEERSHNASSAWRRTRRTAHQHIREARRRWRTARSMAGSWETT